MQELPGACAEVRDIGKIRSDRTIMSNGKLIFADLIRIAAMLVIVFWHVISNMSEF
jgi:hypothetical protein